MRQGEMCYDEIRGMRSDDIVQFKYVTNITQMVECSMRSFVYKLQT